MARTAHRGRRGRVHREPQGPLGLTAGRVRALADQVRDHQATTQHLAALQQRRGQLEALTNRIQILVEAARVLRSARASVPRCPELAPAQQATSELRERFEKDPQSVRHAQPLSSLESPLQPLEDALLQSWHEVAAPPPGAAALAQLLTRFPQFREAQMQIARLCEQLDEETRRLPKSADDRGRVLNWQQELEGRIEALEGEGMDADVQRFLRGSAAGVPLDQLLGKPHVLEFLRTHDLLSSLTVRFQSKTR